MSNTRRKIGKLVTASVMEQPLNKKFLTDVMTAIELRDMKGRRKPSRWYKPSSLTCLRQMYFTRTGEETDGSRTEYTGIGMADTGTRRHEAIQEALMDMKDLGFDWEYVDVENYILNKQKNGKCLDIQVADKRGAETHLYHKTLFLSFMCDGIIRRISTGECFLFEFKNQVSFKYSNKTQVDSEHVDQVSTYCLALDLDKAFVLYENRDVCSLECPEVFEVTAEMKQKQANKILECESYVEQLKPPAMHSDTKICRWCQYKIACKKVGAL